jgi:DNA-binding NtrC family response regulator
MTFEFHLGRSGYEVLTAESAEAALNVIGGFEPEVIFTDLQMPGMNGLELLRWLKEKGATAEVIVITGHEDMRSTIGAMRDGAYDYLVKPIDIDQLDILLQRCFRDRAASRRIRDDGEEGLGADLDELIVGRSRRMVEIYKQIGMLAITRTPVLVRGESGTGKELVARAIHSNSAQATQPFIAVNCTALSESLLESELFGHVKGSFTGAVGDRRGRFELAGSGTIFLDEIGDTTPEFQAKLLRVLQEREYYPVGGERPKRAEARVIAATHRPIEQLIRDGRFREDLYFRLRVVEVVVPPLRERPEDIPILAEHLLRKASRDLHKRVRVIPAETMRAIQAYSWPGNVRELENSLTRAVVLAQGPSVAIEHLLLDDHRAAGSRTDEHAPADDRLESVERAHVMRVLERTGGNKRRAAHILGISRPRLDRTLARLRDEEGNGTRADGERDDEPERPPLAAIPV